MHPGDFQFLFLLSCKDNILRHSVGSSCDGKQEPRVTQALIVKEIPRDVIPSAQSFKPVGSYISAQRLLLRQIT